MRRNDAISLLRLMARLDAFCARLNDGLAAFAVVLAMTTALTLAARHPEMVLPPLDAESATGFYPEF